MNKRKTQFEERVERKLKTQKNESDMLRHTDQCENIIEECPNDLWIVQLDEDESSLIGDHETQESEGGEADLHKHLAGCKKNPGHRQFIPVDTFTLKHLPEGFQDNDLYEYVKVIADLTVRVSVTKSSPHRPEFWPKTTQPYPFSNISERRHLRTGSGRVWFVNKFQDGVLQDGVNERTDYTKCWCRKCEDSGSASNVWWEFDVYTATHVVFDDIEASHTALRLFYDRDMSSVVLVDKVNVENVNIAYDLCELKCVTCEKKVGNKLMEIWKNYKNIWLKIFNKYINFGYRYNLNFIVSHPHGCAKHVSVGKCMHKYQAGDSSKFTYTTSTCPGSSGAHVQCVGFRDMWWVSNLVHSGSLKSGLNYSSVGLFV